MIYSSTYVIISSFVFCLFVCLFCLIVIETSKSYLAHIGVCETPEAKFPRRVFGRRPKVGIGEDCHRLLASCSSPSCGLTALTDRTTVCAEALSRNVTAELRACRDPRIKPRTLAPRHEKWSCPARDCCCLFVYRRQAQGYAWSCHLS